MSTTAGHLELRQLIEAHAEDLEQLGKAIIDRDRESAAATVARVLVNVATGVPLLGRLASTLVLKAFANTATARLLAEYELYAQEQARARLMATLATSLEALIGQAVVAVLDAQQGARDEMFEALGGLRRDLADFRAEFTAALPALPTPSVRVDLQEVFAGALGIRVSTESRKQLFVAHQRVSGPGAVGILLE